MQHTGSLFTGLTALSLSLGLLVGCAAPAAVTPAPVAPAPGASGAASATTPETTAPAAVPAMPAPAAVAPVTLTGTATFRGEPVAGYAVTVIDATTGKPVALRDDLAGATGLAVLNRNLKTDAQGKFSLQVVGLAAGKALRVQVSSGNGRLESILTANGQSMGAKGYRVAQAETEFSVTELTTAIAKVADDVIRTTQMLTPEAAAPLLAKLAADMASLSTKLEKTLTANPNAANDLVSINGKTADETVKSLITNAGALRELTQSIAELVADVAKSMGTSPSPAASDPAVRATLDNIQFTGTVLVGNMKPNGIHITNGLNGQSVDANGGNLSTVTSQITTSSNSGTAAPSRDPNGVYVADYAALIEAIDNSTASTIYLTQDISEPMDGYRVLKSSSVDLNRAVTLDGQGHTLGYDLNVTHAATVKDVSLASRVTVYDPRSEYRVAGTDSSIRFEDVKFVAWRFKNHTSLVLNNPSHAVTVTKCTFGTEGSTSYSGITINGTRAISITGSTFNKHSNAGIEIKTNSSNLTISGNTFTGTESAAGIHFNYMYMPPTDPTVELRATFKSGNTFNGTWTNEDAKVKAPQVFVLVTIPAK